MGLLDEAIREHLELKRRRGADPGAVAREEREALAPAFEDAPASSGAAEEHAVAKVHDAPGENAADDGLEEHAASDAFDAAVEQTYVEEAPTEAHALPTPGSSPVEEHPEEHPAISQETAELDMQSVIGEDGAAGADSDSAEKAQGHFPFE
ncbi:MAG TPA: hypothetical protein VMD79_02840 [Solirubrobacteraceae bacterium]|nr:hypothetical protein [Solirubrobacteraceae bacterium]